MKLIKILFVLLTALAVLNCSSNSDDGSAADPIIGTWKGDLCRTFKTGMAISSPVAGSERETYTFTSSTALTHLQEVYLGNPAPGCDGMLDIVITSQYNITIGSSNYLVAIGTQRGLNGTEIDYTLNSVEAVARTTLGETQLNGIMGVSGVTKNKTVDLLALAPASTRVRPNRQGTPAPQQGMEKRYLGAYYIKTSVSPRELYTQIGEAAISNRGVIEFDKSADLYKRQ